MLEAASLAAALDYMECSGSVAPSLVVHVLPMSASVAEAVDQDLL